MIKNSLFGITRQCVYSPSSIKWLGSTRYKTLEEAKEILNDPRFKDERFNYEIIEIVVKE